MAFRRSLWSRFAVAFLFLVAAPTLIYAQSTAGAILGTVVDPQGERVPGATITLTNPGTNQRRETASVADGRFTFSQLPPSEYVVQAQLPGFAPSEPMSLTLNVGDERIVRMVLSLAGVQAAVTVTAEASRLQGSPAVGTVIEREFIANMPLSGRSFQSLFDLAPGVMRTGGAP